MVLGSSGMPSMMTLVGSPAVWESIIFSVVDGVFMVSVFDNRVIFLLKTRCFFLDVVSFLVME